MDHGVVYMNLLLQRIVCRVQGVAKKHPLQKSHYFQNNLIFFGELFRGYS